MWQTDSKNVRKVLDKLRKMSRYERIIVRDWLNSWYDYQKEQDQLDLEQMGVEYNEN